MNFHRKKRPALEITLTPMIDVVFLLLIFFMVTTTFTQETGLDINLPEASNDIAIRKNLTITLLIDAEGNYFVSTPTTKQEALVNLNPITLKKTLNQMLTANNVNDTSLVISADGKTSHTAVIKALDIASQVGFKHIAFATEEPTNK